MHALSPREGPVESIFNFIHNALSLLCTVNPLADTGNAFIFWNKTSLQTHIKKNWNPSNFHNITLKFKTQRKVSIDIMWKTKEILIYMEMKASQFFTDQNL